MISSPWKITCGSTVILDYGERLDDEIDWGGSRVSEVVNLIDADTPFIRDAKNKTFTIKFQVQRDSGSDAASATAMLDGLIAWGGLTTAILKVQRQGITTFPYWQFARCLITATNAKGRAVGLGLNLTTYQITAAGLTKVSS